MVYRTTLTSKGQVTLPKEIRNQFGIKEGDQIAFEVLGDRIQVKMIPKLSIDELFDSLRGSGVPFPGLETEKQVMRERHLRRE
ncbi:MAG: AbrB/MazE/SpoVT family DNA-binding domain-containing protein [Truepera sp.]|nr:AbrB/MazE/SpoVT family DNA-binding domain-containing protein [Truepera sp.]